MLDRATRIVPSRLRYRFDNYMAWSAFARFVMLLGFGAFALFLGVALLHLFAPGSDESKDMLEALWWSYGRVMDPGTGTADSGPGKRAASIVTTLAGLCVFVLLIGTVATTVQDQLQRLRQTGAPVAERGHTLILGFGDKTLKLIEEIAIANLKRKNSCVVILSARPKDAVIHDILAAFGAPKLKRTRIVVREGSSTSARDLLDVAIAQAKSVIVLSDDGEGDRGDVRVMKTLLTMLRGLPIKLAANVVVELDGAERMDILRSIEESTPVTVVARDFLSRLMVQSIRQTGLASVYAGLLSFEGAEFHLVPVPPALVGKTFRDAWRSVKEGVVSGLLQAGAASVTLCPDDRTVLGESDRLLALLEDESARLTVEPHEVDGALPEGRPVAPPSAQRILILGYRPDLGTVVSEIDHCFPSGTEVSVLSSLDADECKARILDKAGPLENVKLETLQGDITLRRTLEQIASRPFDAELLIGEANGDASAGTIDARTLMALLLMRSLERSGLVSTDRLVSEIRDPKTKELASIAGVGDFIVSDELVSQLLAQVSESRELASVWNDLASAEGHEIYLKPAGAYVDPDDTVSFLDVMARARSRSEIALGWSGGDGQGFDMNPRDKTSRRVLGEGARVAVIAQTDG